ncbi:MAG: type I-U CRISPR-associated helicase/endonuclease Cas3 [Gemmataceae bacterium]|nr:type I-U CRISPR-associated helicase/endonuclease Cas3 [Gemmataceae bacterium]
MTETEFAAAFEALTGNPPFPWQRALYGRFVAGDFPSSCTLPTGLGKTNVIAVWLLALATAPAEAKVPRRLVYVVNRRTVVDQSTRVAEGLRERLHLLPEVERRLDAVCALPLFAVPYRPQPPLAISTLRGQFADNREWAADPARPAVVVGTVDMVGSRLLFSGYGCGFKTRPLFAGLLGQDALLVHDEAHLEQPFQDLLEAIVAEQGRCKEFGRFHVTALTATPRGGADTFELTEAEKEPQEIVPEDTPGSLRTVWQRLKAKKGIAFHTAGAEKGAVAGKVGELAVGYAGDEAGPAVLVFVRTLDDIETVVKKLGPKAQVERLTGTIRGRERDGLVEKPVFRRFLPDSKGEKPTGTVYLVCTSAGEVGIDISADHLVCDLTTLESMAQRLGRVNRRGTGAAKVDVVYESPADPKKKDDPIEMARRMTLVHLQTLPQRDWIDGRREASPHELGRLMRRLTEAGEREAAFSPPPDCVPTSDILFDAWALTTVRDRLPGRPPIADYLHGVSGWEPPETHVAWRQEVEELNPRFDSEDDRKAREAAERKRLAKFAATLLDEYPLKPHELLRDRTDRVFDHLKKLKAPQDTPVWLVDEDDAVRVTSLGELVESGKDELAGLTVLLSPKAGGLKGGILAGDEKYDPGRDDYDVAGELFDANGRPRRVRLWTDAEPDGLRLIRKIELGGGDDEDAAGKTWYWYESPQGGDGDGSRSNKKPVRWQTHTDDVVRNTTAIVGKLLLPDGMGAAIIRAAEWHDLGKLRPLFQRILGNPNRDIPLAKSGANGRRAALDETYRHEFGSLLDAAGRDGFAGLGGYADLVLHLIAAHHGRGRPHFPADEAFDPGRPQADAERVAREVPRRYARLQRRYGRWGLAYLESLLRAADYAASASPSAEVGDDA